MIANSLAMRRSTGKHECRTGSRMLPENSAGSSRIAVKRATGTALAMQASVPTPVSFFLSAAALTKPCCFSVSSVPVAVGRYDDRAGGIEAAIRRLGRRDHESREPG